MRFVIIGGGPAGNTAASTAARLGAEEVTLIERDVIGGGAHLWDCIPSKAMVATGEALARVRHVREMGIDTEGLSDATVDLPRVAERISGISRAINESITSELLSQQVCLIDGTGRLESETRVHVMHASGEEEFVDADAIFLATGSRPLVPDWAPIDHERVLTSRDAYSFDALPEHIVIVGSGVTGVEFAHIFAALGAEVTLVASRRHVLPAKDPEVAYALEEVLVDRQVTILKGGRAASIDEDGSGLLQVGMVDGRVVSGTHVLLAVGSYPCTDGLHLEAAGVKVDEGGHVPIDNYCRTNVPFIYAGGDITDKVPLSSLAAAHGRLVGRQVTGRPVLPIDYRAVAQAIFTHPEIADVGVAEAEAFAQGRKIRVTKVPFWANPKAVIEGYRGGFVKIISDPLTGQVLGGSIVGAHAAELISTLALAVRSGLSVRDIVENLNVHPSLSESLADAAE